MEKDAEMREFIDKAQRWQDTWNFYRPSFGIGMNGKTPFEKLRESFLFLKVVPISIPSAIKVRKTYFIKGYLSLQI